VYENNHIISSTKLKKKAKNTRNIEANNEMKPMKGEKKMKKMTFFFPHLIILRFRACYFPFFQCCWLLALA
jgi:hypothetical protein